MVKKQIVISVLSKDRPGIIADIANIIYELKGDLADMSQSVLNGFFSMIILANFDAELSIEEISKKMDSISTESSLTCIVKETVDFGAVPTSNITGDIYVVTAQGKNRTGLVAAIGSYCKKQNINIIGYVTKLNDDTYSMMLDIVIPDNLSADSVHDDLAEVGGDLGLSIVMQHKSLFETVNEISLR